MSIVGKRIHDRRIELGLSADALAERLGKNRATIYRYEGNDIENMPLQIIQPLAEILSVSPAYLMGWSDIKEHPVSDAVRKRIDVELGSIDPANVDAARESMNVELLDRIVDGDGAVTVDDALEASDMLGITMNDLLGIEEPAPKGELSVSDLTEEEIVFITIFSQLNPEHRKLLLANARIYLQAQGDSNDSRD